MSGCDSYRPINSCWGYGQQMDNSHSTIQKLSTLYCDPEMSDLQLVVGDKVFHTHKLILSISSDVLKTMLTSPTWPESYKDQIVLQEDPECVEVFGDFLHYLYTGRIHMSHLTVLPILSLADKYNIGDLTSLCIDYMCSHCVATKHTSRVLSWYTYATMCGHKQLERVCEEYIVWNFQFVIQTDDFLSISAEILVHFFQSPDVVVKSELSLYQAIKKWVMKKLVIKDSSESAKSVSSAVQFVVRTIGKHTRFTLMTYSELQSLQDDGLVENFPHILASPIKAALQVHIAQRNLAHQNKTNINTNPTNSSTSSLSSSSSSSSYSNFLQCEGRSVGEISTESPLDGSKDRLTCSDHQLGSVHNHHSAKIPSTSRNVTGDFSSLPSNNQSAELLNISPSRTLSTQWSAAARYDLPRIYTCDSWCTEMVVPEVAKITPGDVLGAFFSTPVTGCEEDDSCYWDWHIDLYPKGVTFKKCMMIGMLENREIDEVLYKTVRLTVTSNTSETRKVKISVMVIGEEEGLEYVVRGLTKTCIFDDNHVLFNISDIIPYTSLHGDKPLYKIGDKRDTFKITVVIRPALMV
ncbi:uncharacterized protein LOC110450833 [Mizuhopecten yessoensis]|uniref:BTB/POZ domain-containing protein 17 n=1 Tax=Mizuhopecten yessoensis TaxID=6573 RepID=A0A210QN24_MIZYE|nr:uncharacterized protein LOC110450833 [Mizuhopecten yessoensis]OWF50133.1 BTB/POZ domain-containing protein 17 [Mizuhopecten yessoensis]